MTVFEFSNILWSILFSLAFAHVLASVAGLIQAGRRVRWSPLHAVWLSSIFICVVGNWIGVWGLRDLRSWTTGYIIARHQPDDRLLHTPRRQPSPPLGDRRWDVLQAKLQLSLVPQKD